MSEKKSVTCPKCGGTGSLTVQSDSGKSRKAQCPKCDGTGKVTIRVFMKPAA